LANALQALEKPKTDRRTTWQRRWKHQGKWLASTKRETIYYPYRK